MNSLLEGALALPDTDRVLLAVRLLAQTEISRLSNEDVDLAIESLMAWDYDLTKEGWDVIDILFREADSRGL